MTNATVTKGSTYTLPACTFTSKDPSKEFEKWSYVDGNETVYAISEQEITVNSDLKITAEWKDITQDPQNPPVPAGKVTISFDPGGGSGNMNPVEVDANSQYELPACEFEAPHNQVFDKWNYGVAAGETGTTINVAETDITLTALWRDLSITPPNPQDPTNEKAIVTFIKNGHGGDPATFEKEIQKGTTVEKPKDPTDDDFDFGGWYTESTCENEFNFDTQLNENTELFAKWTPKTANPNDPQTPPAAEQVTIKFLPGEGAKGTMTDVKVNKNSEYTLPASTFTAPENKEFKAWKFGEEEKAVGATINVAEEDIN